MRILQLTKKLPFPLTSGEAWAVTTLAEGLKSNGAEIDLFTIYPKQEAKVSNKEEEVRQRLRGRTVYSEVEIVDTEIMTSKRGALENLVTGTSYHADRFDQDIVRDALGSWMQRHRYEAVLVETVYMMHYVEIVKSYNPDIKVVLRAHNVEHVIWQRYAKGLGSVKSWYFKDQSKRLKSWEVKMMEGADLILPVSENDADIIKGLLTESHSEERMPKIYVSPIGMRVKDKSKKVYSEVLGNDQPLTLGYIGLLDWRPNVEGLNWFINSVWPAILKDHPNIVLKIAGRNSHILKLPKAENVTVVGEVIDSDAFFSSLDVMIAPLLSGSGTRVKILQSLRVRVPVICTNVAKEGLELTHEKEVFIADSAEEWTIAVSKLLDGADETSNISKDMVVQGQVYLEAHHDINRIGRTTMSVISSL